MKGSEFKHRLAYEIIIFLGLMALVLFITRIWAILFLIILGIFIAVLVLLFRRTEKVEIIEPIAKPETPSRSETEKDILRLAYSLIQRRITEDVESLHPSARWQWLTPNAMASIERDEPVVIILNGAAGYRRASVQVHNLTFKGLAYETVQAESTLDIGDNVAPSLELDDEDGELESVCTTESDIDPPTDEPETVNYEYLAFEWVDAHLLLLNNRSNEAIAHHENTLLIPENELPVKESWQDICQQLIANDFADAVVADDGIRVSLMQ